MPVRQLLRLKDLRERSFLSMDELAKKSRVSKITIFRLENGKSTARGSTVRKLAEALGVKPEELTGGYA